MRSARVFSIYDRAIFAVVAQLPIAIRKCRSRDPKNFAFAKLGNLEKMVCFVGVISYKPPYMRLN
jgi:hypothetical protein